MRRRIPLNAVRAFEAAARHQSLVRAANELCVTPTAISHQIRLLEDFLQIRLFIRKSTGLELTPESKMCLEHLTGALDTIDNALKIIKKPPNQRDRINIGASVSVATKWLMPRLHYFLQESPGIDVAIMTFVSRRAIEMQEPDLWICNWQPDADRRIEPFLEEEILPVCSPRLADEYGQLSFDSLRHLPLIHTDRNSTPAEGHYPSWERYLGEYGLRRDDVDKGPRFNQGAAAVEAAKAGFGMVLGRSILLEEALAKGELVQIAEAYPVRNRYYVVSGWNNRSNAVDKFRDWLLDQMAPQQRELEHTRLL